VPVAAPGADAGEPAGPGVGPFGEFPHARTSVMAKVLTSASRRRRCADVTGILPTVGTKLTETRTTARERTKDPWTIPPRFIAIKKRGR